jgi:hypothetical protein
MKLFNCVAVPGIRGSGFGISRNRMRTYTKGCATRPLTPVWSHLPESAQEAIPFSGCLSDLRYLENSITLAELPAVSSLPARYRLLQLDLKFLETKDAV